MHGVYNMACCVCSTHCVPPCSTLFLNFCFVVFVQIKVELDHWPSSSVYSIYNIYYNI